MSTSQQLKKAVDQGMTCRPGGCKACQRTGLPLLPLRRVVAPTIGTKLPDDQLTGATWQDAAVRTLRAGYLYVLLDDTVWQAYQVTPEGCLRQFNPFDPPQGSSEPLTPACIKENHDVPASFINIDMSIDTKTGKPKYSKAHIAFANDAWPKSVLDAYLRDNAPTPRFTIYDLVKLRDNPASVMGAMAFAKADDLSKNVWEYAPGSTDFASAHGFYSRAHRVDTMATWAHNAAKLHKLSHGIPVVVVPDPIGMVQEYNALRLRWAEAKSKWTSDPLRTYQWFTSQSLLRIRDLEANWSASEALDEAQEQAKATEKYNNSPMGQRTPWYPVDVPAETKRLTAVKTEAKHKHLEKRYNESDRLAFQRNYDDTLSGYQSNIDQLADRYARACRASAFIVIDKQDYDAKDISSRSAYIRTMALCFRGGITDALPKPDKEGKPQPETGITAQLWKDLVSDKNSAPYKAMLACDKGLLSQLAPIFDAKGEINWQDTEKVYTSLTKLATSSDVGERLVQEPMKQAAADLLSAYNGAVERLRNQVTLGVQQVSLVVNTCVLRLYQHLHVTQIAVEVKLGDYYAALCETLHDQQKQLTAALRQALGKTTEKTGKQVRSLLSGGLLSLAVADPKVAEQTFKAVLWLEGEATKLRDWARTSATRVGDATARAGQAAAQKVSPALQKVAVLAGTLEPKARELLKGLQLTGEQTASLTRTGMRGLGGALASSELLVSIGGTYLLAQGLKSSFNTLETTVGAKYGEAQLAVFSASMGVVGGCVEGTGIALKQSAQRATGLTGEALDAHAVFAAGRSIARAGAVVGAMAGFADAVAAGMAANRAARSGDSNAKWGYRGSSVLSLIGAGFASYAAYGELTAILSGTALLGPVGWAILLGVSAYLVYKWAEGEESTPFERWARRCYFGKHDETPSIHWNNVALADKAIAALNAIVLGADADMNFARARATSAIDFDYVRLLSYRLVLPYFDAARSGYQWTLTVQRYNGTQMLTSGAQNSLTPTISPSTPPRQLDYDPATTTPRTHPVSMKTVGGQTVSVLTIEGRITLDDHHDIDTATLHLDYWPDRTEPAFKAELTLTEKP